VSEVKVQGRLDSVYHGMFVNALSCCGLKSHLL